MRGHNYCEFGALERVVVRWEGVQIPTKAEIWFKISAAPVSFSQIGCNEYHVNGKMRQWGRGLAIWT